jgi:hypothetical protein
MDIDPPLVYRDSSNYLYQRRLVDGRQLGGAYGRENWVERCGANVTIKMLSERKNMVLTRALILINCLLSKPA